MTAIRSLAVLASALAALAPPVQAHPHVYIDGGVDFVLRDGTVLEALEVTWHYDAFETLYILASNGMSLNADGALEEADRRALAKQRSTWPSDFDGSAHLSRDGVTIALDWPTPPEVQLADGRLEMRFRRWLTAPIDLAEGLAEVALYESTYFFAFTLARAPEFKGQADACSAEVIPFNPDTQLAALQTTLYDLGREETPDIDNVGALFADRVIVRCG